MHEVNDEDLGKLKFLRVSEARNAFREVMEDGDKIVVTRHGDPIKILLDYAYYKQMIAALKAVKS